MASSNPPPFSSSEAGAAAATAGDTVAPDDEACEAAIGRGTASPFIAERPIGEKEEEGEDEQAKPTAAAPRPLPPPSSSSRPLALAPANYGTVFTNAKAGMEAVDFDHVKRVVFEASANSLHGAHQRKKDEQLSARVEALREKAASLQRLEPPGGAAVSAAERSADALASKLLRARDGGGGGGGGGRRSRRDWVCLDMDAFFFSVEARGDPGRLLRADPPRPFAVGSASMITTANGEARKYGVRSAMPGYIALRLCPHLQFIAPHFDKYVAASKEVMACLGQFDPRFEPAGLDEAFLDVTDYVAERRKEKENENFSALDAANEIRAAVRAATSLPCSAGLAPNRMLAKMASDLAKPDGAFEVPSSSPEALAAFVGATAVRKVPGIGRVTERILEGALGVKTCAELFAARGLVFCLFGPATAEFLLAASLGVGSDEHSVADGESDFHQRKGLSAERTFTPTADLSFIDAKLCEIAERVAEGVQAEGLRPKTLTLKVKLATFEVVTRAASAGGGCGGGVGGINSDPSVSSLCAGVSSFSDAGRIAAVASALFRSERFNFSPPSSSTAAAAAAASPPAKDRPPPPPPPPPPPVRLLGIRLSNWENAVAPVERGQRRLDDVMASAAAAAAAATVGLALRGKAAGEGGSGSEAEAEAAEAAAKKNKTSSSSATWTCSLCTYAETRNFSLRCDVCGTPRGATGCGSLLAEKAVEEERAVAGGRRSTTSNADKKRPLASSSAAAPLDAFFVRKK